MLLSDRQSKKWFVATLVIFLAATVFYGFYSYWSRHALYKQGVTGPHGGSWIGLAYGSLGSAMILFAMALALKKKLFRTWRIGKAYTWMQGHVWLGLLAYPMILYHAGFAWGGLLTQVLMWAFTLVVITGVLGLILQQYVPTKLLRDVPKETIYEQIDHIIAELNSEADTLVKAVVDRKAQQEYEREVVPAGAATAVADQQESVEAEELVREFYDREVKPILTAKFPRKSRLAAADTYLAAFRSLREAVPSTLHESVDDLQSIVDERRQLERQRKLQLVLHGWLLVHVPLSYAMTLLAFIHAFWALRYTTVG